MRLSGTFGRMALVFFVAVILWAAPSLSAAQHLPSLEVAVAFSPRLLPGGAGGAGHISVHLGQSTEDSRFILGGAYARELDSHGSCCGPNAGYSYQLETIELSAGIEIPLLKRVGWSLAVDGRASPMWYHAIRRGYQSDFTPRATSWHSELSVLSFGVTGRVLAASRYQVSARFRTWLPLDSVLSGASRSASSVGFGFGW